MGCTQETQPAPDTLRDRPGLSSRDRGKLGPSGESNAQPIESMPLRCAGAGFLKDARSLNRDCGSG